MKRTIKKVAVLGSGVMGSRIACHFAGIGLQVLLLERADHPGYWQSVTGSQNQGEILRQTAIREVFEETGLDAESYAKSRPK